MKTMLKVLLVLLLVASSSVSVLAAPRAAVTARQVAPDEIVVTLAFERSQFEFSRVDGYDHVWAADMVYLPEPGLPELPWKLAELAIPFGTSGSHVEVAGVRQTTLDGTFRVAPTQPPTILGEAPKPWVGGKASIYEAGESYPERAVGGVSHGLMGDHAILSFYVCPFTWNPATGELLLATEVEIRVTLSEGGQAQPSRGARRVAGADPLAEAVSKAVANPDQVARFEAAASSSAVPGRLMLGTSMLEAGNYEYVVVTIAAFAPYFEPLVAWKTQKGIPARTVTREWIEATYSGANVQEKIRNFITDAYANWGTNWVLLGGDTGEIPGRTVYAMDCQMGWPDDNRIRADLYYSDLDGNWNANGVNPYGEVADSVDMYPDVIIGRAPAENVADVETFVSKVLTYEENPPAGNALKMLMAGEILWTDPYTDAGRGLDMIDAECVPPRFDPILKLYASKGNESPGSVMEAMQAGLNIFLHDGHCNENLMGMGTGYIYSQDADALTNGPRNFILNSIGCWPAAIDRDCIAEHFVENPNGGAVAFIGNCRYGWGSPGNPGFGYSDVIQRQFARTLFVDNITNLGLTHAVSKAHFVPFARDENVFRWNEYQLNLLGDPEMPVWTDEPRVLAVDAPASVQATGGEVEVAVSDEAGACSGARVCLANGHDVYLRVSTGLTGRVTLPVSTTYADSLTLTVTAENHVPHQQKISVVSEGCLLAWSACSVVDGGDNLANPGETVALDVTVKNVGSQAASGVWGLLRAADSRATVLDSTVYYGLVGGGSVVGGTGSFRVALAPSLANGDAAAFDVVLTDTTGAHWTSRLPLVVATPVLEVTGYGMDDLLGDGNWIAEPGETVMVALEVANTGLTTGSPVVHLTTPDPYLDVHDSIPATGPIAAGAIGHSLHRVIVAEACPAAHVGLLEATATLPGGAAFLDSVYFNVGDLQFYDNCEGGVGGWTHEGTGDLWHLSSYRSHSGSTSWYVGNEATHTYSSNTNARLTSEPFIAGDETRLSVWFWYDFTTYGVDGIYVIVEANGVPDTLDYFGSGGALNIVSRWAKWERQLTDVTPGAELKVRFGFKSDGTDVAEGIYLDDIALTSRVPGKAGVNPGDQSAAGSFSVLPNPARGRLALSFSRDLGAAAIEIFDITGRRVARLAKPAGASLISWDLVDGTGARVAPGIYVARMEKGAYTSSRKIVVLR
ncbi:MAG TPA: C25 family cysteine peptidase [bacterium]|nr:C25 family cysteine peptidase [bacterium]